MSPAAICSSRPKHVPAYFILLFFWGLATGQIRYSIPEELEQGAYVGDIVKDLGLGLGRLLTRSVKITSSNSKQYLDINLSNGNLFVNDRIDRETLCELRSLCLLHFEVVVENPLEVYNVEVEILDVNDNAPRFPRNEYRLEISESALPGARFPVEGAQDPDVGSNSIRMYSLSQNEHFTLDSNAPAGNSKLIELVLKKALDREQKSLHQLVLTAVDGGTPARTGTATIAVRVLDSNDNVPVFDKSVYKVKLLENAPRGMLVIKLNATDLDEGSNGELLYSFSSYTPGRVREIFSIDQNTGEIRVNGTVDYEETNLYEIYVQAVDNGASAVAVHCKVIVEIIDLNDNTPEIVLSSLSTPVREDARPDTVVALVSVSDKDSEANKQVTLQIPSDIPFKIKSYRNYYTLVTAGFLDREKATAYNITFTAIDSGTPILSSQKTVLVEVSDVNDSPPCFEQTSYSVYIDENNAPGSPLCTVNAIDPDVNENAIVSYSILSANIQDIPVTSYVSINSDTGIIYALRSFDYEKLREFQFEVKAQDAGIPPLSSIATVYVYVVDQNDNAPQVLYPSSGNATEMVPRTANAGHLVTKLIALDADSGQNAWLFYHLLQATDTTLFKVNQHTGEIRITRKIGEENSTSFNLTVLVKDSGQPSLSATATIHVVVVDRVTRIIPDPRRHVKSSKMYSDVTLYLIIALSAICFVFLLTIILLAVIRCHRYSGTCCLSHSCTRERHSVEMYKQANSNLLVERGLKVQPHFIEVKGNGSLSQTYCYKACLTAGSGSDTFMFYDTGCPARAGPSAAASDRYLTGQSGQSPGSASNRNSVSKEVRLFTVIKRVSALYCTVLWIWQYIGSILHFHDNTPEVLQSPS